MDKGTVINRAKNLYINAGKSCSESVLLALKEGGIDIPDALLRSAAGLRAGIGGSGCVCGALMASVLAAGLLKEKDAQKISAALHDKFKGKYKSACCRVLTRKYDFQSQERKTFCAELVGFMTAELLKEIARLP